MMEKLQWLKICTLGQYYYVKYAREGIKSLWIHENLNVYKASASMCIRHLLATLSLRFSGGVLHKARSILTSTYTQRNFTMELLFKHPSYYLEMFQETREFKVLLGSFVFILTSTKSLGKNVLLQNNVIIIASLSKNLRGVTCDFY